MNGNCNDLMGNFIVISWDLMVMFMVILGEISPRHFDLKTPSMPVPHLIDASGLGQLQGFFQEIFVQVAQGRLLVRKVASGIQNGNINSNNNNIYNIYIIYNNGIIIGHN